MHESHPPKYTIFLPVRNGENYLQAAIESVISQTFDDWHLVILENQSTDRSLSIAKRYECSKIEVLLSEASLGIWENWNRAKLYLTERGLSQSYCTLIGHDDYFHPTFLENINLLIEKHPEASLYQTYFNIIDSDGELIRPCRPIPEIETGKQYLESRCWGLRDSYGTGYVFRADDYCRVGGIPNLPQLLFADDLLFYRLAAVSFKACSDQIECAYRLHRDSASSARSCFFYESQVEALHSYIQRLRDELGSEQVPSLQAAMAALLARDAMLYTNPLLLRLVPPLMRTRILALKTAFYEFSGSTSAKNWTFTNVLTRTVYDTNLILRMCFAFGKLKVKSVLTEFRASRHSL